MGSLGIEDFMSSAPDTVGMVSVTISTPLLKLYFELNAFSSSERSHHQLLKQIQVFPNLSSENLLNPLPSGFPKKYSHIKDSLRYPTMFSDKLRYA